VNTTRGKKSQLKKWCGCTCMFSFDFWMFPMSRVKFSPGGLPPSTKEPHRLTFPTHVRYTSCKGRFTRYGFVACHNLAGGHRRSLFHVNQTWNSTFAYVSQDVQGFSNMFLNAETIVAEIDTNDVLCGKPFHWLGEESNVSLRQNGGRSYLCW